MTTRTLILGLIVALAAPAAADTWTVKLEDGETHDGALVRIEPGRYLLQTDGQILELTDDDLDGDTFSLRQLRASAPDRPLGEYQHYDEVHADGTVTMHWEMHVTNRSNRAITEIRFGLAPWERAHADQRRRRDPFGNELTVKYDPPRERWQDAPDARVQATLQLVVPVAPGETMVVNGSEKTPMIQQTDAGYRFIHAGDFAEDRLIWRKVRLPHGAEIVSISPDPTARFTADGYEYVMWRRYYVAREVTPLEIVYKLD